MWRLRQTDGSTANGTLGGRSIKVCRRARQTLQQGLRILRVAGLLDETLEALCFEVQGYPDDGEVAPALVQFVVVGVDALRSGHTVRFGRSAGVQQSGIPRSRGLQPPGRIRVSSVRFINKGFTS